MKPEATRESIYDAVDMGLQHFEDMHEADEIVVSITKITNESPISHVLSLEIKMQLLPGVIGFDLSEMERTAIRDFNDREAIDYYGRVREVEQL